MLLAILAAAAVAAPADAAATPAQPATTQVAPVTIKPKPESDPNRMVCIDEAVTGSHRPTRVCRRQSEIDQDRRDFRDHIQGGGRTKSSGGLSPS